MQKLRFAVIGCGFWSQFQIAAWGEFSDQVELLAVCDQDLAKAQQRAAEFGEVAVYQDANQLFSELTLDFVDVITDVETHPYFVQLAAQHGVGVICQKPMAPTFRQAQEMVAICKQHQVPFMVHENFRWQTPVQVLKEKLESGVIGRPFKARVSFCSHFPVFENQPFLAELDQFILTDIGSHILDIARFLFGEANSLYCKTQTINPGIKGEDVANVLMEMDNGLHCYVEMSYASILEEEPFPQTLILIEGTKGSMALEKDFMIRTTTKAGTTRETISLKQYKWADPDYALIHSSIVECNRDILFAMQGKKLCETSGEDNLRTVRLLFDAYDSATSDTALHY